MKGEPVTAGRNFLGKGVRFLKRDLVVFTFFLLLSFFFWYLNSLRKDIEAEIRYPVRFINPPRDRMNPEDLPQKLIFSVKGPGYSLVKLNLSGRKTPVSVDFSKAGMKKLPDSKPTQYFIVSSALIPSFTRQLRPDFQILAVKPDTLFVTFERKVSQSSQQKDPSISGINGRR